MIEPKPYRLRETKKRICIVDTETDPFKAGRKIAPFTVGFYDTSYGLYIDFWGADCVAQFFAWLKDYAPASELVIYAHNGGKFDFFFFYSFLDIGQEPVFINGRMVVAWFQGVEFRDSYAIIPVPLSAYDKEKIDYAKFERPVRDKHRAEILAYQKKDCVFLADLVCEFHAMLGDKLTIGSAALPMLRSFHGFEELTPREDEFFRQWYFGGRVQCFEIGVLQGAWKYLDVRSEYPSVMKHAKHPVGKDYIVRRDWEKGHFAKIRARNYGALPARTEKGAIDFGCERGTFYATNHEIEAGLETGTLVIEAVESVVQFKRTSTFADFVDAFFARRKEAIANGDEVRKLLYKLLLNSSYGKFAQDPRKYHDYQITDGAPPDDDRGLFDENERPKGWRIDAFYPLGGIRKAAIWKAAIQEADSINAFKNVATAASITGAARALLLRGIAKASRPVYCDTDSLICLDFAGDIGDAIGQWNLEATGDTIAIAGKKLYALFQDGKEVKKAAKGVQLTASEIRRVARGETIESANPVPNFKRDGSQQFISREIKATGKPSPFRNKKKVGIAA